MKRFMITSLCILLPATAFGNTFSLGYRSFHPAISSPFYPGIRDEKNDGGMKKVWDVGQPKIDLHGAEISYAMDRWRFGLSLLGGTEAGNLHAVGVSIFDFVTAFSAHYRWKKKIGWGINLYGEPGVELGMLVQDLHFTYQEARPSHQSIWMDGDAQGGIEITLTNGISLEGYLGAGLQWPLVEKYKYAGTVDFGWWNLSSGLRLVLELNVPKENPPVTQRIVQKVVPAPQKQAPTMDNVEKEEQAQHPAATTTETAGAAPADIPETTAPYPNP